MHSGMFSLQSNLAVPVAALAEALAGLQAVRNEIAARKRTFGGEPIDAALQRAEYALLEAYMAFKKAIS